MPEPARSDDRALQDALIRLLADTPFRDALYALGQAELPDGVPPEHAAILCATDPERVRRFARFLARHYYYERVVHFFRYSRALARWTGRSPEQVLRSAAFDELLPRVVLGSVETARAVVDLVERHLGEATSAPPYFADLRRYEGTQMLLEAGPRVWRDTAPAPRVHARALLVRSDSAVVVDFEWDLPGLLPELRALARVGATAPPTGRRAPTRLVIARSPRGRITVLRWTPALEPLLDSLDGERELADVATAAGVAPAEIVEVAAALVEAGVLHVT